MSENGRIARAEEAQIWNVLSFTHIKTRTSHTEDPAVKDNSLIGQVADKITGDCTARRLDNSSHPHCFVCELPDLRAGQSQIVLSACCPVNSRLLVVCLCMELNLKRYDQLLTENDLCMSVLLLNCHEWILAYDNYVERRIYKTAKIEIFCLYVFKWRSIWQGKRTHLQRPRQHPPNLLCGRDYTTVGRCIHTVEYDAENEVPAHCTQSLCEYKFWAVCRPIVWLIFHRNFSFREIYVPSICMSMSEMVHCHFATAELNWKLSVFRTAIHDTGACLRHLPREPLHRC